MKPFDWSEWYMWLKMAFKMSQEFPAASLDITKDFHILHSAYVYICYSILKAETYNWLPNSNTHTHTHTHTHTQQQQTKNSHLTGSDTPFAMLDWHFWCLFCFFHQYLATFPAVLLNPNKAYLLCATPAGTYQVQSPGFPKIIYWSILQWKQYDAVCHCIRHQCFVLLPNVWVVLKTCFAFLHNIVARNNVQHSIKQTKGKEKSFCAFALHQACHVTHPGCLLWAHGLMEEMLWHVKVCGNIFEDHKRCNVWHKVNIQHIFSQIVWL